MDSRWTYLLRRFLLIIPTFLGITLCSFLLCQFVPGGPVEMAMLKMRGSQVGTGEAGGSLGSNAISEKQREELVKHFGFDRPVIQRYWNWLVTDKLGLAADSYVYTNKKVGQIIVERFPVSLTFGIAGFLLTYLICIPLGLAKALRHEGVFDLISSLAVFVGYAIPPFAFGMLLKLLFAGSSESFWDLFPLGGFRSENWIELGFWGKVLDQAHHMFLPVICYVIGNFAVLTLLMKNSLLDQISQDYVRTVVARGGNMRSAVWAHAMRNAMIPIATGFGGVFSIMFAGSVLIERVFNIPGIGLLSLDAIVNRDYMVFMGILALTSIVSLVGRIVSDFLYLVIDPRITFSKE